MIKQIAGGILLASLMVSQGFALNGKAYQGTWAGKLKSGKTIQLTIPADVDKGGSVSYVFDGQSQAAQTPAVQGNAIRLTNPGTSFIVIGPVHGTKLPYKWSDGGKSAATVLVKQ